MFPQALPELRTVLKLSNRDRVAEMLCSMGKRGP
jgi:hypothetical protein